MIVRAEFALFAAAIALSVVALLVAPRRISQAWRVPTALLVATAGTLAPLLLYQLLDPSLAAGRALWEWSAAGGPTIQASYRLDGLGTVGIAAGAAYVAAGLLASARSAASPRVLPSLVLVIGFVFIAVVVTIDLVAAIVALAVLAAATAFATVLVAPAPSAMRLAAYLAAGLQGFVVAALLIARQGGPSLAIGLIAPTAISPGAILAATAGAALFAGLYPFVPWRYERARATAAEREPLRGLLAMPAGVAASLILLRVLGATNIDLSTLGLPSAYLAPRLVLLALILIAFAVRARRRGRPSISATITTVLAAVVLAGYDELRWSHLVLAAALFTVLYAAAVSLALPDQWEVARHDVTLATLWVAFACGTPVALGAGLFVLVGAALSALAESVWMPPHRAYIATMTTSVWTLTGVLGVGVGAASTPDLATAIAAIVVTAIVLGLELAQAGRRLALGEAPPALDVAAALVALGGTVLLATILALPIPDALR
ncbi:MAG TPA: hypothetical protein VGR46_04405, partial [Candidatus Limnocylindria bacterium]|nr:hypothetical protein [Candidatus Limnocylindria bacterium]